MSNCQTELPALPAPWDFTYEWVTTPFGVRRSFSANHYNGSPCTNQVPIFTAGQMRAYATAAVLTKREQCAGVPWWQIAKDCGAWTDKSDRDYGYVHFGSTEALRVFVVKITAMAYQAGRAEPIVNRFGDKLKPEVQRFMEDAVDALIARGLPPAVKEG